jgi:hypothetical protein
MKKFQALIAVTVLAGSLAVLVAMTSRDQTGGTDASGLQSSAQSLAYDAGSTSGRAKHILYE